MNNDAPTHLDLFSGIGGFSLAFEAEGFRTIGFSEIDPYASAILKKHWPHTPNFGDIGKLCRRIYDCEQREDESAWCSRCNAEFGECECVGADEFTDSYGFPTVITGGFPCQDISANGKGAGLAGNRSGLWFEFLRIIRELRPAFCLIENVANLRTKGADTILSNLDEENYAAESFVVGAWAVNGEHNRERAWILAYDKSQRIQGMRPKRQQVTRSLDLSLLPLRDSNGQWQVEPDLCRANDGLSNAPHRLKCLGNAIVPRIAQIFAKEIYNQVA